MNTPQECAKELMSYKGDDPIMNGMKEVLRARAPDVSDLFVEPYKGADGDVWRMWKMRIPRDPQGDWVWQQLISPGGNDSKDMVESS